jgi:glycosyltransferase involved in cell wall biosynthesis
MGLSVCMIVKNEAHCIENAIKSVLPIADEIVVVDTGSTDGTPQKIRDLIGRVYFTVWKDDFSAARNTSLSLCTMDWVMWLDADDIVPESSYPVIRRLISESKSCFHGATIKNIKPADIDLVQYIQFKQARLFPRMKDVFFQNRVHETFSISAISAGLMPVENPDFIIEHHGYQDKATLGMKKNRNIRLMLKDFGFPENADYYEFNHKGYFCLYTPNVLVAWLDLAYVGAVDIEFIGNEDRHEKLVKKAEEIINTHQKSKVENVV